MIRRVLAESVRSEKTKFKAVFLDAYSDYKIMSPRGEGEKEVRFGLKDATKRRQIKKPKILLQS